MELQQILDIFNTKRLPIHLGESYESVIEKLGQPLGLFVQKKHQIKILKYKDSELSFKCNKLQYFSYNYVGKEKFYLDMLEKDDRCFEIIEKSADYIIISYNQDFSLVFDTDDNSLFKIKVAKTNCSVDGTRLS